VRFRKQFGVAVTAVWLGLMSVLVARDVVPAWRAQPMPPVDTRQLVKRVGADHQAGIYDGRGQRIGTTWSSYLATAGLLVTNTSAFERAGMLSGCLLETQVRFTEEDVLDEFAMTVSGPMIQIELKGENYDPDFPCELRIGTEVHTFKLDAKTASMMSDAIRPFHALPKLEVGKSWTMQVFDLMGAIGQRKARISPAVVKVTGKERIESGGRMVECFVVESNRVRAWVDENGLVLVQEMDLPLIGRMVIRNEPFDDMSRRAARESLRKSRYQ
jgi:hypothetical protein